jgi:hypothetical protein
MILLKWGVMGLTRINLQNLRCRVLKSSFVRTDISIYRRNMPLELANE